MHRRVPALIVGLGLWGAYSSAQPLAVDWWTVDGGGGVSTGGAFEVAGTLGQPDAAPRLSGGAFVVVGGFWSMIEAIQTPGGPLLQIEQMPTNTVKIFWPAPSTGWELRYNAILTSTNWMPVALPPAEVDGYMQVILSPSAGYSFYQLSKTPAGSEVSPLIGD